MHIVLLLISLFFLIALVYSMVGFGGGSSYIALLILFDVPYQIIPPIALICNLVVVCTGSFNFIKAGHFSWKILLPFIVTSIPAAYIAGTLPLEKRLFLFILAVTLLAAGLRMLILKKTETISSQNLEIKKVWILGLPIGGVIGGLSGLVGIGGGIFLSPILHNLRWGKPKQISASASIFILVNSLFGLIGQSQKHVDLQFLLGYLWLPLVVFGGGLLGSSFGSRKSSQNFVMKVTAIIILTVAIRIFFTSVFE